MRLSIWPMTGRWPSIFLAILEARVRFFCAVIFEVVEDPSFEDARDEIPAR